MHAHPAAARVHLAAADPTMARIIAAVGELSERTIAPDPFHALARSIIYQQLSGKAAGTIFNRVALLALPPDAPADGFPPPDAFLALTDEELRGAGLSRQKVAAVRDLAAHFASGALALDRLEDWDDEQVIAELTRVRGVGRWTAEMFLMHYLRRPDVLPVNDAGINRAIMLHYALAEPPLPDIVREIGAPWRPHATVACWYLWQSLEIEVP